MGERPAVGTGRGRALRVAAIGPAWDARRAAVEAEIRAPGGQDPRGPGRLSMSSVRRGGAGKGERVRLGAGRRVGRVTGGQPEAVEDRAGRVGGVDLGQDFHAGRAARAAEGVQSEHPAQQLAQER